LHLSNFSLFFKNITIFTISRIIKGSIPFFILPVLTRWLTPYDFGIVATFQTLLILTRVFVELNVNRAMMVNYFKMDIQKFRIYISNIFFVIFINFIIIFGLIYFVKKLIFNYTMFPEKWILIVVIYALFQTIISINLTLWMIEKKAFPFATFQILQTIFDIGLSLIFIISFNLAWRGRLLGMLISCIFFGCISLFIIYSRGYIIVSFNKNYIKDILYFGIPLIPYALGGWIITGIDRIFINTMVSIGETGVYAVGYRVGSIISLLATSLNIAWIPFLFEKLKEGKYNSKIKIVKFTYLYDAGILVLALFLSFIAPYFLNFFVTKNFYFAYKYVFWIALGYAFHGMYLLVSNYIFYVKKTYILSWVTFFSAGINIILNYFLIKANGAIGAAQATTITFFIVFILTWILSAAVYKMPWGFFYKNYCERNL